MKHGILAIVMACFLAVGLGGFSADLEAKKFGGGKSFGKSYSVPKSAPASTPASGKLNNATQPKKSGFLGGLGGGLLGGLLAGGLFAALMGSGAFDGLAFGDILLFALIGFLVYKFFIAPKRRAAYAGMGHSDGPSGQYRESAPQSGQTSQWGQPVNTPAIELPPGFNKEAFLAEAKNHYASLQKAWDENNFDEIRTYVSQDLCQMLMEERARYGSDKPATEVVSLMVDLVRGEIHGSVASITLKFSGWIKEGEQTSDSTEYWHLEKDLASGSGNWVLVGIQQDT